MLAIFTCDTIRRLNQLSVSAELKYALQDWKRFVWYFDMFAPDFKSSGKKWFIDWFFLRNHAINIRNASAYSQLSFIWTIQLKNWPLYYFYIIHWCGNNKFCCYIILLLYGIFNIYVYFSSIFIYNAKILSM